MSLKRPFAMSEVGRVALRRILNSRLVLENGPTEKMLRPISPFIGQTLGIVGDWGTGEHAAASLLTELKKLSPDTLIYLGDIYYSGTMDEVHDNLLSLCPEDSWLGFLAHRLRSFPCVRITTCTPVEADITG
jgi:hypothetical protein